MSEFKEGLYDQQIMKRLRDSLTRNPHHRNRTGAQPGTTRSALVSISGGVEFQRHFRSLTKLLVIWPELLRLLIAPEGVEGTTDRSTMCGPSPSLNLTVHSMPSSSAGPDRFAEPTYTPLKPLSRWNSRALACRRRGRPVERNPHLDEGSLQGLRAGSVPALSLRPRRTPMGLVPR